MIVVDTSALIAILRGEDEAESFKQILISERCRLGAATKFELLLVMGKRDGQMGVDDALALITAARIAVVDWTSDLADQAAIAALTFGRGRHPAALNSGDCVSYALAKSLDAPLLYKGNDFSQTDIICAA